MKKIQPARPLRCELRLALGGEEPVGEAQTSRMFLTIEPGGEAPTPRMFMSIEPNG